MTKAPKFSVLLPTRDRLDLAKSAIETVRRQTYGNWELVVADNCSADDVAGYVASLSDSRILYTRSDTPLPVTANWSRAMDASSGDYVLMLGDDDGLTPGYFERVLEIFETLGDPDFLYHGAYIFTFPGAIPDLPKGALTDVTLNHSILQNRQKPELLAPAQAHAVARAALDMRAHYGFNMQYFVFSRRFLQRMAEFGPFFQGPFPDFYAANLSMLKAERIGVVPKPLVIIGISPKSYGFYHFNKREKGGINFLNTDTYVDDTPELLRGQLLPGTNMNTSWLISVALIPKRLGDKANLKLNIARYRRLQIIHNLTAAAVGEEVTASMSELWPKLNWNERFFSIGLKAFLSPASLFKGKIRKKSLAFLYARAGQYLPPPSDRPRPVVGQYDAMLSVFEGLGGKGQ